jgi:hypothetical protein
MNDLEKKAKLRELHELITEHKHLVKLLHNSTQKERNEEASEQSEELKEYKEKVKK